MISRDRRMLWGLPWAVDILFFAVAAKASNEFVAAGAVLYGVLVTVFMLAEQRTGSGE